jgi:iron(II)-dependent oxidoreductase
MEQIQRIFATVPHPPEVHSLSSEEFRTQLDRVARALTSLERADEREAACRMGLAHPVWQVRALTIEAAAGWLPLEAAEQAILHGTHDSVDVIAFLSIRLSGERRLRSAIGHLVKISGWPSMFMRPGYLRKPVGIGASKTMKALVDIFGSQDPAELARLEEEYLAPYRELLEPSRRPDLGQMIRVPGGPCIIGTQERTDFRFEFRDFIPTKTVDVPEFYIDRTPVTNAEYLEFARAIEAEEHATCHPDEPPGRDHWPSHLRDPRFGGDDMPVTAIDWYDAYAYASWRGKKLPTETQWEKAARGTDGRDYPWGNQWRKELVNYVENVYERPIETLEQWRDLLRGTSDTFPARPLWNVGAQPGNVSPYGVLDMAGNTWEWTRTNFFTLEDMDPFLRAYTPEQFMNRREAFVVIRGGCWTSLPEMTRTYYRGKDLFTDRHFEIGFRCVYELEDGEGQGAA